MTWRKYFTPSPENTELSPISGNPSTRPGPAKANYSSYLPDVYMGSPNRIDRYQQYEVMDSDPEINAALDILAEFCTQKLKNNKSPFSIQWRHPGTNNEIRILAEYLQQWNTLQKFDTKIFRIVRNTFKYGDSFFIRDPETQAWSWIDPSNVVKVIVNESEGKKPEQYIIKDLAPNFTHLVATQITTNINPRQMGGGLTTGSGNFSASGMGQSGPRVASSTTRFGLSETEYAIDAQHIVHLSLSEGLDTNYPFGNSLLENIFKVYKQKELLEEAILIYRIQRAPERRVFHIDVGNMPGHMAMAFVERVKNEIHQRRIPSQCLTLDTKIPLLDGRTLPLSTIIKEFNNGHENWVFSCDPSTGNIVPGIISWAGITGTNKQTVRLVFDNQSEIVCTPEHKFPIPNKGFIEAKDLDIGETFITGQITNSHFFNQENEEWESINTLVTTFCGITPNGLRNIPDNNAPDNTPNTTTRLIFKEYLQDTSTVGTITVDGNEIYHDFHTFLLDNGVFTKNSGGGCFTMDTNVPLLDGRLLTIQELSKEYQEGKINWAYSCDPTTLALLPGKITWAGVTQESAQIIELTLDNNAIIRCTPEHKFPILNKGKVEAKDIVPLIDELIQYTAWDYTTEDTPYFFWDTAGWMKSMNRKESSTKKITSIRYLDSPTQVGTITIDGTEELHSHHTFAIAQGVYTYNSNVVDSAYNPLCISLNTEIPLLDGRTLTLSEIIHEYNQGKENWAYSCHPSTGKIVPGIISWAGITKHNANTIKIILDNNNTIVCTPDHKFPVFNKGFVEAQHLTTQDKLIYANIQSLNKIPYIWDHEDKQWITAHNMVGRFLKTTEFNTPFNFYPEHKDAEKTSIHHIDGNAANNNPTNIVFMNKEDHLLYHMTQNGYQVWEFNNTDIADTDNIISHRSILSIEPNGQLDVGTLSIDSDEKWHNYHTFAIKSGVFIKNSINEDYFFPRTCLSLTEKIALIDGRDLPLIDIIKEFEDGKDNWVYTVNQNTHEIEVGKIEWAGVTRKNTQVVKVTLDNGNTITVTPDHLFIMRDGSEKEAQYLVTNDTPMPVIMDHNIKVTTIEWLPNPEDTGDITVSSQNDNHNFGLTSGVFIHNSEGRGSSVDTLPGGCLAMDTTVSLLDGRELSIKDIETEMKHGKTLWTYSCEPITGKIVPGLISWAGVTQKSAKVMKITLDNGKSLICTPDHKFPTYDTEAKRADEFRVGDSLIPLYRRKEVLYGTTEYEQFYDNSDKTWKYTHRMVSKYLKDTVVQYEIFDESISDGKYGVCHHKDYNRYNNDPSNLCFMSHKDHVAFHGTYHARRMEHLKATDPGEYQRVCITISETIKQRWQEYTDEEYASICKGISDGIKNHVAQLSPEGREVRAENSRKAFKQGNVQFNHLMDTDPEFRESVISKRMEYWTPENREARGDLVREYNYQNWNSEKGVQRKEKHSKSQSVEYSHSMLISVIDMIKGKTSNQVSKDDVVTALNNNKSLLQELEELNQSKKVRNWTIDDGFTATGMVSMVKQFGYAGWKDFRMKESIHNHRIAAIEYLDDPIEVGTLTIDQHESFHNYHNFALSIGIITINSNLGEIDDLKFFTNKLFRGLRIPSSYLPTGADDSQASFNDGRVGTAYIQELRFNKYCERLQTLITEKFDTEFKMYMYTRGLNVDANIFELQFNPPMNFASSRQSAVDAERINTFNTIQGLPFMSKRFAMKRFLGLTDEEMAENERLYGEESGVGRPTQTDAAGELRSAGLSAADIEDELGGVEDLEVPDDLGITPEEEGGMMNNPPIAP